MKISDRTDPEQSIKAGSEYLHWLISQLPESIEKEERIWFALVAYNIGLGHLIDARRLTQNLGGNPDNWFDVKKSAFISRKTLLFPTEIRLCARL